MDIFYVTFAQKCFQNHVFSPEVTSGRSATISYIIIITKCNIFSHVKITIFFEKNWDSYRYTEFTSLDYNTVKSLIKINKLVKLVHIYIYISSRLINIGTCGTASLAVFHFV